MKKQKGKLFYSLLAFSFIPLSIYALIIVAVSSISFTDSMEEQVEKSLRDLCNLAVYMMDTTYPGDYYIEGDEAIRLYKGDADLTESQFIVDSIKEKTNMEASIFYQDTRILTTIRNWNGERLIGKQAPSVVIKDVLEDGNATFYNNVVINSELYYAYYAPLRNSNGNIVGILFVGEPAASIKNTIRNSLAPILIGAAFALVFTTWLALNYSRRLSRAIRHLQSYLEDIKSGNLTAALHPSIMTRGDELSDIGAAAASMQRSIRQLVERDALTDLYNRRSGEQKMTHSQIKCLESKRPLSLVLCDIDFFKKVNDTYGHESGDIVLKNVARLLKESLRSKGYAIRWGGEEFLLVFENHDKVQAHRELLVIKERINDFTHEVTGDNIHITMTYGVACDASKPLEELVNEADNKLYEGKRNGRNQIVS